jgi:hypothetical protein
VTSPTSCSSIRAIASPSPSSRATAESSGFDFESAADPDLHVDLYENGGPVAPERVTCAGVRREQGPSYVCAGTASDAAPAGELGFYLWRDARTSQPCATCPAVSSWHLEWRGSGDHHLSGIVSASRRPVPHRFHGGPATGGTLWKGGTTERFSAWRCRRSSMTATDRRRRGRTSTTTAASTLRRRQRARRPGGVNRLFVQTAAHDFVLVRRRRRLAVDPATDAASARISSTTIATAGRISSSRTAGARRRSIAGRTGSCAT